MNGTDNNVSMVSADNIAIKGHFWNELSNEQASKILPVVSKKHKVDG